MMIKMRHIIIVLQEKVDLSLHTSIYCVKDLAVPAEQQRQGYFALGNQT